MNNDTPNYPAKGFVFVVTFGRTGSTVLQSVLQSIGGYHIRGENNNALAHLFGFYESLVEARTKNTVEVPAPHGPWYGINEVDPEDIARQTIDMFVRDVLHVPAGTVRAGFKDILFHEVGVDRFHAYMDFIRKFFTPAKIIFNTRNVDAVANSGWWKDEDYYDVLDMVETCDALYSSYTQQYPEDCIQTRYEDLKGNPMAFERLYDFLGEPFDEAKVDETLNRKLKH